VTFSSHKTAPTSSEGHPRYLYHFRLAVVQHVHCCLIASFYLVDRGLWHRLPGISGFGPACCSSVGPP
jgi:hypothetical protein